MHVHVHVYVFCGVWCVVWYVVGAPDHGAIPVDMTPRPCTCVQGTQN